MPTFQTLDGINRLRAARLHGITMPIVTCHYRTMSSQVTDPRDALFSRLGMASDGYMVEPNYTDAVYDVFTSFVLNHIRHTKSLDIIHVDARPRTTPGLPSWVPDWTAAYAAAPLQPDHKGNARISFPYYSACASESVFELAQETSSDRGNNTVLRCKGYVVDTVDGVSHACGRRVPMSWERAATPMSQPRSRKCAYANDDEIFEALWRSVVLNQEENGTESRATTGSVLARSFQAADRRLAVAAAEASTSEPPTPALKFDLRCCKIGAFEVFGQTISQRMSQAASDSLSMPTQTSIQDDVETCMAHGMGFKRVVTTDDGFLGTAPYETQPGDVVALLIGSTVPVVLHPVAANMYTVVGEVYIHGIMYGEAMEKARNIMAAPTVFCLT